jgi:hypothetical protein
VGLTSLPLVSRRACARHGGLDGLASDTISMAIMEANRYLIARGHDFHHGGGDQHGH